jgi:hypothetical protein
MKKQLLFIVLLPFLVLAQKETSVSAPIKKVTVFKSGAQIEHNKEIALSSGKQVVVFTELTDFVDPNSIQLKCSPNAVILSVRTRKNFDDVSIAKQDVDALNEKRKTLEKEENKLRDEYMVLLIDEQLLMKNNQLGSQQQGVKVVELKEASVFYHSKMTEIQVRKSQLEDEIETVIRKINTIEQEITTRRSLPVKNYTEIEVELTVEKSGSTEFTFNYITPNASWKPYYDMRSNGIGAPVLLEAKGLVSQNTGIEWKNVQLVLSTNDPYDNTQEPTIDPWYLDYYSALPAKQLIERSIPVYDYTGEMIHGEVLDGESGEPLAFAKISMGTNPANSVTTDATGKFNFMVPRDEQSFVASYLGYSSKTMNINAPYIKVLLTPETIAMETVPTGTTFNWNTASGTSANSYAFSTPMTTGALNLASGVSLSEITIATKRSRKSKHLEYAQTADVEDGDYYSTPVAMQTQKDLRIEFTIETPFSVPSDNADHRVAIAVYQMAANYEYHAVPKLDDAVYLIAQISGWEKLNLLSGESNLYFDGTFIGKSYVDVNSSKDTLSFSLGKDKKFIVERKKIEAMSQKKLNGSRYKYDVAWEFTIRNNGSTAIPLILKDHFPISTNEDIKVKKGNYEGATLDETTSILTWRLTIGKGEIKKFKFDYSVDYGKSQPVYLE